MTTTESRPKLNARRRTSRSGLSLKSHRSRFDLRDRGKILRRTLQALFRKNPSLPKGEDYLTQRLPAEIRLQIYRELLQFHGPMYLCRPDRWRKSLNDLAIVRVSHQTHREALPILYDQNIMSLQRSDFCALSSPVRSAYNMQWLRRIHVRDLAPVGSCRDGAGRA